MKIFKQIINLIITLVGITECFLKQLLSGAWTFGSIKPSNCRKLRIIANGPTMLEDLNAAPKEDVDYLMVNFSVKTDCFWEIKPTRYVIIDPGFFSIVFANDKDFVDLMRKVDWEMEIFVPVESVKEVRKILSSNSNISISPTPHSIPGRIKSVNVRNIFFKYYLASPPLQNVLVGAIYTAIMSGYRDIELYGAGHSWTTQLVVNDQNVVCLKDLHYYEKNGLFKPWVRGNGEPYHMHSLLIDLSQMFSSYWDIKYFIEHIGSIRIVNMTKESYIDAFERGCNQARSI